MPELLRNYVIGQLDSIIAEIAAPMNTGVIPTSLARQLQAVVRSWPDVWFYGVPLTDVTPELLAAVKGADP